MSNKKLTLEEARGVALRCEKALDVAGRVYVDFPFNKIDLADALIVLRKYTDNIAAGVTKDEHLTLVRKHNAMKARYVRMARKHNEEVAEDDGGSEV